MHIGVRGACLLNLLYGKTGVNRAVALPENEPSVSQFFYAVAAERLERVPNDHLVEADAHLQAGIPAEVLIWQEQDAATALQRPLEGGRCVG